jgi:hypothetical protein
MEIDILGIDLAKQVFQLHTGQIVADGHRAKVSRGSLAESVRTLKPWLVIMGSLQHGSPLGPAFRGICRGKDRGANEINF